MTLVVPVKAKYSNAKKILPEIKYIVTDYKHYLDTSIKLVLTSCCRSRGGGAKVVD